MDWNKFVSLLERYAGFVAFGALNIMIVNVVLLSIVVIEDRVQDREQLRIVTIEKQADLIGKCLNDAKARGALDKDWSGCLEY